jgi:tight adherence protein B
MIEQSGVAVTPGRLLAYMAGAALVGTALGLFLTRGPLGLLFAVAGAIPYLYVWLAQYNRMEKMLSQLPDAFDLMARVIRAGQTTSQALQAVADEFSPPLAAEFAFCFEQQNLGLPPEASLRELARRTGLLEIKIFVLGLLVQQQAGGNLAELLEKLAAVVRSRYRIRGKVSALTAEGRMQAAVLLLLPPALFLLIYVINPGYMSTLLNYPLVLGGIAVSEFIGALWIRNIVNFDF